MRIHETDGAPSDPGDTNLIEGVVNSLQDGRLIVEADGQEYGPCPYMPRPERSPASGDACLVAISDEGLAWVVVWEPA